MWVLSFATCLLLHSNKASASDCPLQTGFHAKPALCNDKNNAIGPLKCSDCFTIDTCRLKITTGHLNFFQSFTWDKRFLKCSIFNARTCQNFTQSETSCFYTKKQVKCPNQLTIPGGRLLRQNTTCNGVVNEVCDVRCSYARNTQVKKVQCLTDGHWSTDPAILCFNNLEKYAKLPQNDCNGGVLSSCPFTKCSSVSGCEQECEKNARCVGFSYNYETHNITTSGRLACTLYNEQCKLQPKNKLGSEEVFFLRNAHKFAQRMITEKTKKAEITTPASVEKVEAKSSSPSGTVIIAIIIACVLTLALLIGVTIFIVVRKMRKENKRKSTRRRHGLQKIHFHNSTITLRNHNSVLKSSVSSRSRSHPSLSSRRSNGNVLQFDDGIERMSSADLRASRDTLSSRTSLGKGSIVNYGMAGFDGPAVTEYGVEDSKRKALSYNSSKGGSIASSARTRSSMLTSKTSSSGGTPRHFWRNKTSPHEETSFDSPEPLYSVPHKNDRY